MEPWMPRGSPAELASGVCRWNWTACPIFLSKVDSLEPWMSRGWPMELASGGWPVELDSLSDLFFQSGFPRTLDAQGLASQTCQWSWPVELDSVSDLFPKWIPSNSGCPGVGQPNLPADPLG